MSKSTCLYLAYPNDLKEAMAPLRPFRAGYRPMATDDSEHERDASERTEPLPARRRRLRHLHSTSRRES